MFQKYYHSTLDDYSRNRHHLQCCNSLPSHITAAWSPSSSMLGWWYYWLLFSFCSIETTSTKPHHDLLFNYHYFFILNIFRASWHFSAQSHTDQQCCANNVVCVCVCVCTSYMQCMYMTCIRVFINFTNYVNLHVFIMASVTLMP